MMQTSWNWKYFPAWENRSCGPCFRQDLERLQKPVAALAVRDVEALVVPRKTASPHAEFEAALGDVIDRRDILGQAQGVAQREDLDGDADLDASRAGGERRGDHQGRCKY
jgi:hypothetical protein